MLHHFLIFGYCKLNRDLGQFTSTNRWTRVDHITFSQLFCYLHSYISLSSEVKWACTNIIYLKFQWFCLIVKEYTFWICFIESKCESFSTIDWNTIISPYIYLIKIIYYTRQKYISCSHLFNLLLKNKKNFNNQKNLYLLNNTQEKNISRILFYE